jgi:hypothetical protein
LFPNNELKDNRYVGRRAVIFYCKNISKKFEKVCKNLLTNEKRRVIIVSQSKRKAQKRKNEKLKMKKWDGTIKNSWVVCPNEICKDLFIDDKGNVFYNSNGKYFIWCAANRLSSHIMRLKQILNK